MILGEATHSAARCFREIDDAVRRATHRLVVFNAHRPDLPIPEGAVVYNLDLVGLHFSAKDKRFDGREIWDFSARNVRAWREAGALSRSMLVRHVPVGYHPSMERFSRRPEAGLNVDVAFVGAPNERRSALLRDLRRRGLVVEAILDNTTYGAERDALLARCRTAVNPLYYEDGVFPVLRSAHLAANLVPTVAEAAPETPRWAWVEGCCARLADLAHEIEDLVRGARSRERREALARRTYESFRNCPLVLPPVLPPGEPHKEASP